ncbi:hypothetical protein [Streptomyces silaceus]|uniref:hypothetical protein n=1 Tax=Streptomyces silaceus TaxID=545123 RepID=UPI0006EB8E53|nr:hypothetical protein [Streptomyces silaceus]
MDTGTARIWDALPPAVRERVDELVLADRMVVAMKEIWEAFAEGGGVAPGAVMPRPGLRDCQDVVASRHQALADRIVPPPRPTVADLAGLIRAEPEPPLAIEALWDGDTRGWMVDVVAVFPAGSAASAVPGAPCGSGSAAPPRDLCLATLREGGDLRILNGQVPPWPEAVEARRIGAELAELFGVPFHFASPDEPDDQAPRWWETP